MRALILTSLLWTASAAAGPPARTFPAAMDTGFGPTATVIADPMTGLPRAVLGLALEADGAPQAAARAVVARFSSKLGLGALGLGPAVVTATRDRHVISFSLTLTVDGTVMTLADRRLAVTIAGDRVTTIHSDVVPFEVPASAGLVTARAAQEAVHARYRAPVTDAEALLLVMGPGMAEPVWRLTVGVIPLADHRVVDVSRRSGRILRESPGIKDGPRAGVTP